MKRSRPRSLAVATLCSVVALLALAPALRAQTASDAVWNALPTETVAAMRLPSGQAVVDAMRQRTKLGAVIFKQERIDKAIDLMKKQDPEAWKEMEEGLAKFGLTLEDLFAGFKGQTGWALAMVDRPERDPLMVMLMYGQPGAEMVAKYMTAIDRGFEEMIKEEKENKPKRVDIEIAGRKAIQITSQQTGKRMEDAFEPPPGGFDNMTPEQIQQHFEEQDKKRQAAPTEVLDQTNGILIGDGDTMYAAFTLPTSRKQVVKLRNEGKAVDLDALTGLEELKGLLTRFLTNRDQGKAGGFAERLAASPGLMPAMPQGLPMFEVYADLTRVIQLADKIDNDPNATGPKPAEVLKAFGVDSVSTLGMRLAMDGNLVRSGGFLTLAAPRRGLMKLFDQNELPPQVPAWVPAEAVEYAHVSFDLGKAYALVKQLVLEQFGQQAQQGFQMAEGQMMMMTQSELPAVLSSVGQKHMVVSFVPRLPAAKDPAAPAPADPDDHDQDPQAPKPIERRAVVWELTNGDIWTKLMTAIGGFAQMSNGAMTAAQEQGFTGYRFKNPDPDQQGQEGALFLGKGMLVLAMGPEVAENVLASLNTPPAGAASLAGSEAAAKARQFVKPRPGLMYSISDTNKMAKVLTELFTGGFEQGFMRSTLRDPDRAQAAREALNAFKALLPTPDEMENALGVSTGQAYTTDQGVVLEGALELPAP